MSTAVLDAPTRTLVVGDKVMILRNLDNPAWCQPVYGTPRDVNTQWVRQEGWAAEVGVGEVTDVRDRTQYTVVDGELAKIVRREIRISHQTWYDAETLQQVGPRATYVTPISLDQETL